MSHIVRRSILMTLVLALVTFPMFAGGPGQVASDTHSWGGYHWGRTANPFTLRLGDNLTSADWKGHLSQTVSDWNAGNTPVRTTIVAGTSNKRCSMVAGTTQVCNSRYGNNGWLGLASINLSGSHISQGSAKMNDTYFDTATYNNTNEREHVMCQEVAHTFGLDHQSTDGSSQNSCMDYFSNTGSNAGSTLSTKPNQHDFDELNTIYAHLDSVNTYSLQATLNNKAASLSVPTRWVGDDLTEVWQLGTPVEWDHKGRATTFVLSLGTNHEGQDETILSHIFWADDDVDPITRTAKTRDE